MQFFSSVLLLVSSIIIIASSSTVPKATWRDEFDILTRIKRQHSGTLSIPSTHGQRRAIQGVINKWNYWGSTGRRPGELYNYYSDGYRARIDLQGIETMKGNNFDRIAVQIGSNTYAVVHIQVGHEFGIALIRNALEQSMDYQAHVFLTAVGAGINAPGDGNTYQHQSITRRKNRSYFTIWVWSVGQASDQMVRKFNKVS